MVSTPSAFKARISAFDPVILSLNMIFLPFYYITFFTFLLFYLFTFNQ